MKIKYQDKIYTIEGACPRCKIFNPAATEAYFCCVAALEGNHVNGCPADPDTFPLPENVRTSIMYKHGKRILDENLFDGPGSSTHLMQVLSEALKRMFCP